jgi:hypothetical protein
MGEDPSPVPLTDLLAERDGEVHPVDATLLGVAGVGAQGIARAQTAVGDTDPVRGAGRLPLTACSNALQPEREARIHEAQVGEGAARALRAGACWAFVATELHTDGDTASFASTPKTLGATSGITRGDTGGTIQPLLTEEALRTVRGPFKTTGLAAPTPIAQQSGGAAALGVSQELCARIPGLELSVTRFTDSHRAAVTHRSECAAHLSCFTMGTRFALAVQAGALPGLAYFQAAQGEFALFRLQAGPPIRCQGLCLVIGQ